MKLTLAEPTHLKESISIISELVNEARFKITKDALELVAMYPANAAMIVFKLLISSFTEYDIKEDAEIAINLGNLKKIIKRAGTNDMVTLELEKEKKLKIRISGRTKRTFSLPIIELEEKEQKIPDLKFPVTIKIPSTMLSNAVEDANIVAESVTFECAPKKFTIYAEGDLSDASIAMEENENVNINIEGNSKIRSRYSIEYLKKMVGASKLSDEVTIQFNENYPLKLQYKTVDKVMLSFILAPRVETS